MDRREFLIRVSIICALPGVEVFIPTAAFADDSCSNVNGGGPSAPGFPWQAMEGVASNLAFALPAPYGAFAAAGLGAIFAGITTDGSGTLVAMQAMLSQAVCALESYMRLLNVTAIESDIQAFFAWVNDNTAQFNSQTVWLPESIDEAENLLEQLEATKTFLPGTLFNDLYKLGNDQYAQQNTWISGDQDVVLSVLLVSCTALICATKLRIQLNAQLASSYAPDSSGQCKTLDADKAFQHYSIAMRSAFHDLTNCVMGSSGYPDKLTDFTAFYDFRQRPPMDYNYHTWMQTPMWQTISAKLPPIVLKELVNVYGELRAYQGGQLGGIAWSSGNDPRTAFLSGEYGSGAQSVSVYANQHGWAAAVERLVTHRWASRLLKVENIHDLSYNQHTCHVDRNTGDNICNDHTIGTRGFVDKVTGKTYQCFESDYSPNGKLNAAWYQVAQWKLYSDTCDGFIASFTGYDASKGTVDTSVFDVTQGWLKALTQVSKLLPPDSPQANLASIADAGWQTNPPDGSLWTRVSSVSYAFCYVSSFGPSIRGGWTALFPVNKRWKPTLRHLPADPNKKLQLQVWRQFVINDEFGQPHIYQVPQIVALVDPGIDQYIDADPAISATALKRFEVQKPVPKVH